MNQQLLEFIKNCPTAFHAVAMLKDELQNNGFKEIDFSSHQTFEKNGKYYFVRNGSSIIAFKMPSIDFDGFMITASHCDSPAFKLKTKVIVENGAYFSLCAEEYGGMLRSTWFDRPLSLAGRVTVKTADGFQTKLFDIGEPCCLIPSVPIHMNRKANENASYNVAEMAPLYSVSQNSDLLQRIASDFDGDKDDIISGDYFIYNYDEGTVWNDFVSSPRLDDLQCVFACKEAFLNATPENKVDVLAVFDNEEVGSRSLQGAASTFLFDVLTAICDEKNVSEKLDNSFMISCDNAHAIHPNHPELYDKYNAVSMNKGVVIKHNCELRYTTDSLSETVLSIFAEMAGVPIQHYSNRSDITGGSTLGNIALTQVAVPTVDIGLAQLAMHSAYETAGKSDTEYLFRLLKKCYEGIFVNHNNGNFTVR